MKSTDIGCENIVSLSQDWKNNIGLMPASYDYAKDFIIFSIIYPVLLLLGTMISNGETPFFKSFIILFTFLLMTANRHMSKKTVFYVLFQFLIIIVVLILSILLSEKFLFNVCSIAAMLYAVNKLTVTVSQQDKNFDHKLINQNDSLSIKTIYLGALIIYFVYIVALFFNLNDIIIASFVSFATAFASLQIYLHFSGAYCLTKWNNGGTQGKNHHTGFIFALWAVVGVALLSLISYCIVTSTGLWRVDAALIKAVTTVSIKVPMQSPPQPSTSTSSKINTPQNSYKSGFLEQITSTIAFIVVLVLIAIVALFLFIVISRIVMNIFKKLFSEVNEESRSLLTTAEVSNQIKLQADRLRSRLNRFSGSSNNMKIRKFYYRYIKNNDSGVLLKSSDTPFEISDKIAAKHQNVNDNNTVHDKSDTTKIYEKARYGNTECDENDVESMKKSVNRKQNGNNDGSKIS